jgi:hypothetical protein
MLKLNASYAKKVPVPNAEFSSQSYHCSMEAELPDGLTAEQIQHRIHKTFALVKDAVEAELHGANADTQHTAMPPIAPPLPKAEPRAANTPIAASEKQMAFIQKLAARKGMSEEQLEGWAMAFAGCRFKSLSKKEASKLIDHLSTDRAA